MVLEVVNDVVFMRVIQHEYDDVIHSLDEGFPLPFIMIIIIEDDHFFHHLVF